MSTDFVTDPGIVFRALRGFDHQGVRAIGVTENSLVLTDGRNRLAAHAESTDDACWFTAKSGGGDPSSMLNAVASWFEVRVISEHDDEWESIIHKINAGDQELTGLSCPQCGATSIAWIMYGLPHFTDELEKLVADGEVMLGGCCVEDDSPFWSCNECDFSWGRVARNDEEASDATNA